MSGNYYQISLMEMREALEPKGFVQTDVNGVGEVVFDFEHPKLDGLGLRVYSSITPGRGRACSGLSITTARSATPSESTGSRRGKRTSRIDSEQWV